MTNPEALAWRRLGCAILVRACRDATDGNGHSLEARRWLAGDGARWLVGALDLDAGGLDHALGELPPVRWEQLPLDLPT